MAFRPHGRAEVNPERPRAFGCCDLCGFLYNLHTLRWKFDFAGPMLQNFRILVCDTCYDTPQPQRKPVIVPPDPLPVANARPEFYTADETDYRVTQDGRIRITQDGQDRVVQSSQWNSFPTLTATGDGSTATVTFSSTVIIPVGTKITVTGINPASYNGSYVVTASSGGSVSFANTTTTSQSIAGSLIVPALSGLACQNSFPTLTTTGTGTIATLTYSGPAIPIGTTITVAGITPTGYNGSYVVTASSQGSVSFANTTTASQTIAGAIIVPALPGVI
jgi:hypothetical protein